MSGEQSPDRKIQASGICDPWMIERLGWAAPPGGGKQRIRNGPNQGALAAEAETQVSGRPGGGSGPQDDQEADHPARGAERGSRVYI
jgi:hypothetical protein